MSRLVGPDVRAGVVELVALGFGGAGFPGWESDVLGLGNGRMSGAWELFSVFFRRRFHASLADGVVVPWRLHSSSTSVKLRQYLCMHMGEVSSSIPSSKGSSEHV